MAQQPSQAKFKVLKALGKGSYGTVYKVQRLADGGIYAMKETDLGRMGPKEKADAVNEIRVLGSMSHPNVVRHHETFLAGNKLCIVMEYAPAGDLASFIKAAAASRLPLPEATVWQIFLQLCQGMQAIHETCVIHRDIKPANIFMCPENVVKVGDLGVAKALTKAHYAQTTIGTPVFMAPEVWRGLRYSYSSDLWSLGGVLYEMMTYRLPFEARSLSELKNKIIMSTFAPIKPGAPYSAALVAVCHALLNKDPRKRPTCAAVLNSSEASPWLHVIPEAVRLPLPPLDAVQSVAPMMMAPAPGAANPQLLPTIHVPRDIRLLPHRLPKPSYDDAASAAVAAAAAAAGSPAAMMAAAYNQPVHRGPNMGPVDNNGARSNANAPAAAQQQQYQSPHAMPAARMPAPSGPSPAAAAAGGGGQFKIAGAPSSGVAQRAAMYEARAAAAAGPGILGGGRPVFAGGISHFGGGGLQKAAPYGVGANAAPSGIRRVPSGGLAAAAAAAGQRAGGLRPPSGGGGRVAAPGGFRPPSGGSKAAAAAAAVGNGIGVRVPSAGTRAAVAAAAGAGGNAAAAAARIGAVAAAGARPPVRRGFF